MGSKLRFLENGTEQGLKRTFQELNWTEMEAKNTFPAKLVNEKESDDSFANTLFIPESGYTKILQQKCLDTEASYKHIGFAALLMFVSEGDNTGDAIQLVSHLHDWLKILPVNVENKGLPPLRIKFPVSWKALFGNAPPTAIF